MLPLNEVDYIPLTEESNQELQYLVPSRYFTQSREENTPNRSAPIGHKKTESFFALGIASKNMFREIWQRDTQALQKLGSSFLQSLADSFNESPREEEESALASILSEWYEIVQEIFSPEEDDNTLANLSQ